MVAYAKPRQRKKEESEKLRGEREIRSSLLILDLKDGRLQDSGKQEEGQMISTRRMNYHRTSLLLQWEKSVFMNLNAAKKMKQI